MVRNKSIVISISLLLFVAMTLADTRFFYLEQEELLECREELRKGEEGSEGIKLWLTGGVDYIPVQNIFLFQSTLHFYQKEIKAPSDSVQNADIPLFIMYCCLKVHAT